MNTSTIITALIIVAGALVWPYVYSAAKKLEARLPASMQDILERYTHMAVLSVEQQSTADLKGIQKRALAVQIIRDLFLAAKLPAPDAGIIGTAIEAAVLLMKQEQKATQPPAGTIAPV